MKVDLLLACKRRRLTSIDAMAVETIRPMLEAAKVKYGREIRVFETSKASQAPVEVANTEETDDFFEFTAEDYYHLMATKKEDKYLKTRKIREAEEAACRSRMTKAVIRVRFPDNHTLEATFHPSERIQTIFDLLAKVLARPDVPYYLYTTPPKKQIRDTSQDFFTAGFVPGAIVYFSLELSKGDEPNSGPFLQEDLMSLKGLELAPEPTKEPSQPVTESAIAEHPPVGQEHKLAYRKVVKPKWLKM